MPERKNLVNITMVTDDDTGMYYVGEIDGMFSDEELKKYAESRGEKGKAELICHLAFMQKQVIDAFRDINEHQLCEMSCTESTL